MHVEGRVRTIAWCALYAALIALAAFRLPVLYDEAYYWTWSRALSATYVDHPPGIAYILRLSTDILGDGYLGLRVPAVLAMGVVALSAWASARRLSVHAMSGPAGPGPGAGAIAVAMLGGSLMFGLGYLASTPDPYQGAALSVASYFLIVFFTRARPASRLSSFFVPFLASFFFVAAVLIKLSSAAVLFGVLLGLASHPTGRRVFCAPGFIAGAICVGALGSWWCVAELTGATALATATTNSASAIMASTTITTSASAAISATNSVPSASAAFQWARVAHGHHARGIVAIPLVLGAMMLTFGPLTAFSLGRLSVSTIRVHGWSHEHPARRALLWGSALLLFACVGAAWLGAGELNWPMPALIVALPVVAAHVARERSAYRTWFLWSVRVCAGLVMVLLIHIVHPFLPIEPTRDRTLRSAGFEAVTHALERVAQEEGVKAVLVDRYQWASMLRYHSRDRLQVVELGRSRRSQYDVWPRLGLCPGDRVLVVGSGPGVASDGIERQGEEHVFERRRGDRLVGAVYWAVARVTRPMFGAGRVSDVSGVSAVSSGGGIIGGGGGADGADARARCRAETL